MTSLPSPAILPPPSRRRALLDYTALVARWALGLVFIYMGLSKAMAPEQFLKLLRQYDLFSQPFLLNSIAATLPWFEVFCGLLLLAGVAVRGTALVLILMLVPFSAVVLRRALAIAAAEHQSFWTVRFDCGCGAGEVLIWLKLLENTLQCLVAIALLCGYGRRLALRFALLRE